jgi:hypothetical protein
MSYHFQQNKYTIIYYALIERAQSANRSKTDGIYYESHHIIPKSLGGNDRKTNLVLLTAREHLVAHLLLARIVQKCDTYRMVNAIRRFKYGTTNSRHFELIRSTISRYSIGSLNPSHGKVWVHNIKTEQVLYVHQSNFDSMDKSIFTKGLPYQRGGFGKGRVWVNNTKEEALIDASSIDDYLSNGWSIGRSTIASTAHLKLMAANRHTAEKDLEHSKKLSGSNHFNFGKESFTKGRVWVNNSFVSKMVERSQLTALLSQGWTIGRLPKQVKVTT